MAEEDSFVQQEDGGNEEREGGGLKEPVYNLLGSLTGTAWKVVEQLEDAQIEADDTFEKILKLLDQSFQYVRS